MFGKKESVGCDKQVRDLEHKHQLMISEVRDLEHKHQLRISEIESEHKLALKEKEFELRHFKDDEMKKLSKELSDAQQSIAVLKKENEMLGKITNLNADIIDIKSLVNNLIEKLPTINLSSLTLNGNSKE